jgi:cohesin complex subunit SCC1
MFYSENILTKEGPLARIWLACHWEQKLTKQQFIKADISSGVDAITKGAEKLIQARIWP